MATLAPSPQPSDLHALRTACESRPLPDTAACSGFQPARPRMLAFPAARRLGARSPRRRGSPAAGRDGVSRVAVRRLPGRHGRRRLPPWRLCGSAAAAPYRLGLPGRACRPGYGRASRLTRAAAGNASPPSLLGCARIRQDQSRTARKPGAQRTGGGSFPRRSPVRLTRQEGCRSGRERSTPRALLSVTGTAPRTWHTRGPRSRPCPSAPRLYLIRLSEPVRYRA